MIMNPFEETKQTIDQFISFIEESPWQSTYLSKLQNIKARIDQPCVLAVAGRVNAGKSSFINALLGKDLAKVGTTETTATINVFRKGSPPDSERPVLVIWVNGNKSYETKEFLDSLQGNDNEILKRAEGIKRIEFLLQDPIFDEITLVDTPGTDAIVGEDGEGHQKITEEFFQLRKRHSLETKEQTEGADAVIYLVGQVANASNQGFLQEFQAATNEGSSAMNAIGIMAKIDLSDEIISQREDLSALIALKMQHELNTVVPVSAGIWRAMDELRNNNKLEWMQDKLKVIPQEGFNYLMKQERAYFSTGSIFERFFHSSKIPPISVQERREIKGEMPWRVFVVISYYLYHYPLNEATEKLTEISGVNKVMEILKNHFFNRGKLLRCFRIINELRSILNDIDRNKLYDLMKEVRSREDFEKFILSHPQTRNNDPVSKKLMNFIEKHLKTEKELLEITDLIRLKLIPEIENLQLKLQRTDENFKALQLINQNINLFNKEEMDELFELFGMYGNTIEIIGAEKRGLRQQYWNFELNTTKNKDRRIVAQYAISAYGSI